MLITGTDDYRGMSRRDLEMARRITEPVVDYLTSLTGLTLVGGLVAIVVLIIWGSPQAAR